MNELIEAYLQASAEHRALVNGAGTYEAWIGTHRRAEQAHAACIRAGIRFADLARAYNARFGTNEALTGLSRERRN